MTAHTFCPHCGRDLVPDAPIIINDFSMYGLGHPLCYRGQPLKLTRLEAEICWTLMKAYPNYVKPDTLLDRIDSDGTPNTLAVLVSRIRRKLADMSLGNMIGAIRGVGYVWGLPEEPLPISPVRSLTSPSASESLETTDGTSVPFAVRRQSSTP